VCAWGAGHGLNAAGCKAGARGGWPFPRHAPCAVPRSAPLYP
jgi:hypothetical protein